MTLAQWIKKHDAKHLVKHEEHGGVTVWHSGLTLTQARGLWALKDYRVSSSGYAIARLIPA